MAEAMREEAAGKTGQPQPERLKPERPRDELGRPQAWEAENKLHLPDFDSKTLEENHRLGIELLRAGNYFGAHEAWETAWKQARDTDDAEFFKGLSQLGAGWTHLLRGNSHGATTLLRRGLSRVERYPDGHRGIHTRALADRAQRDATAVEQGTLQPGEHAPITPPVV
jgi:predicted metal-dependent hydrolase